MLSTGERAASNVSSRTPTQNSGIPRTQAGGEALRSRNKRRYTFFNGNRLLIFFPETMLLEEKSKWN